MKLKISNIYGFADASIEFHTGPTLVTGRNSSGKTSIAKILAALLAHDDNPSGISATSRKSYVRDGNQSGVAELDGVRWEPGSKGLSAPPGVDPKASRHAVGLVDFTANAPSQAARAAMFEDLIIPDDPRVLLEPRWKLPKKQLEHVLKTIEEQGWSSAKTLYENNRRDQKRNWQNATGDTYGAKKAANWVPKHWTPELDGASEDQLRADLVDARDHLTAIMSQQAVSAAEIEEARNVRDNLLPAAKNRLEELQGNQTKNSAALAELDEAAQGMTAEISKIEAWIRKSKATLDATAPFYCPGCDAGLQMDANGKLVEWTPVSGDELKAMKDKKKRGDEIIRTKTKELKSNETNAAALRSGVRELHNDIASIKGEIRQLEIRAGKADAKESRGIDETERAAAETLVDQKQKALEAFTRKQQAAEAHRNVTILDEYVDLLGANGARGEYLEENLDGMRHILDKIADRTGWLPIRIEPDYSVTSNGRPVQLCAKNEQLKAQWSLQLASAYYSGDHYVILDEADTLKDESWEGLVKLVEGVCRGTEMRVIVCATSASVEGWNTVTLDSNA